jgi:hypothetical protein
MNEQRVHTPTPEFRDHLEWEVTRAVRRGRRLYDDRRTAARLMRAAAVVLISVAIGATAGLASAQIRSDARRDSLLSAANADAALAALRLQLAREQIADVTRKVQAGALGTVSLMNAESELRAMEAKVMRARYNVEEITATAEPPRDDFNAPLVGGRDFVKQRIQLELMSAQQRLTAAEAAQAETVRRVRVGVETELGGLEANAEVARARGALAVLAERLKLRQEFVDRATPVEQLARRLEQAQLRQDAVVAQEVLAVARARLTLLEKRRAAGVAGDDLEILKARVEEKMREIELQQLMQRVRAVEKSGAGSGTGRDSGG